MKIVMLDGYTAAMDDVSLDGWKALGCEFAYYDRTAPEEVLERVRGAEIVITNKVLITREIMDKVPEISYIGVLATGYNVVDVEAARERGIVVTNIPAYSTNSVAQMVFAHILHITNNVAAHSEAVRRGEWERSKDFCFMLTEQRELMAQTIGIVGLGNTGMQTARIALAMGMKVLAFTSKAEVPEGITKAKDLDEVFSQSDIVSLHCPLTETTRHMVNPRTLALMRPTSILINTGRGPLIDEAALAEALKEHRILAAGIDVLTEEAPRHGSPLIGLDNCHITPHIAWATTAARHRLMDIALENVKAFISGQPVNRV